MDVVLVIPVGTRTEHGRKPHASECSTVSRNSRGTVRSVSAIDRPLKASTPDSVGACSDGLVASSAAAFEQVEIIEITRSHSQGAASGAMSVRIQSATAEAMAQRRIAARFHRNLPLVRQHDRLQPHQILAPAAARAMDVGMLGAMAMASVTASRQAEAGAGGEGSGAACWMGLSA